MRDLLPRTSYLVFQGQIWRMSSQGTSTSKAAPSKSQVLLLTMNCCRWKWHQQLCIGQEEYALKCIPQFGFLIEVLQCKDEQLEMKILLTLENDLLATLKIFLTFSVKGATAEAHGWQG